MKAINIKCEYLKNPIGIDIESPRIMWNCEGGIWNIVNKVDK